VQKIENRRAHHQGEEEELSLHSHHGQRSVERPENGIDSALHSCSVLEASAIDLGKEPGHEIDGPHRHAYAEYHAGQCAFGSPFAKGKHQSSNHDCDQGQAGSNGPREGGLQCLDSLSPGTRGSLGKDFIGESKTGCQRESTFANCSPPTGNGAGRQCQTRFVHGETASNQQVEK
jgi:hypothetical protein